MLILSIRICIPLTTVVGMSTIIGIIGGRICVRTTSFMDNRVTSIPGINNDMRRNALPIKRIKEGRSIHLISQTSDRRSVTIVSLLAQTIEKSKKGKNKPSHPRNG